MLRGLLDLLVEARGVDFHDYRQPALERGVLERMARAPCDSPEAYRERLARDPVELDRLVEALVVPFTAFFRDRPVFEAVGRTVLPALASAAGPHGFVRGWTVGAATGEEAWTLAMLMATACQDGPGYRLVASDIDARSIEAGRRGRYPAAAAEAVPAPWRTSFLVDDGQEVSVADGLRERVVFARHDLMGPSIAPPEAVVASFNLVSLRNVLIYFDRRLQQKALERVRSVLEPGGALLLGSVETLLPALADSFEPWPGTDPRLHLHRRKEPR